MNEGGDVGAKEGGGSGINIHDQKNTNESKRRKKKQVDGLQAARTPLRCVGRSWRFSEVMRLGVRWGVVVDDGRNNR